jgi:hypothetical protein
MSLAAIIWLYKLLSTGLRRDAMRTLHSFEAHGLIFVLFFHSGARTSLPRYSEAYTLTLFRPRVVPQCFSRVIARNLSPF